MLDSVVGGALFLKLFLKLAWNENCSKLEKEFRFQVIYTADIPYCLEFPLDIFFSNFKVVSRIESKLRHNQNPRYIKNDFNIPCETLAYWDFWYTQNLGILRTWDIFKILWIYRIQFTVYKFLWPSHLITRGIYQNPIFIYNGPFCSETCVTLTYLEPWHIQNLRNIWNPVTHLWCSNFLRTLCNPGIFKTLVNAKPEE